ncbi:glycerate kinase [Mycetohabitans sp. B8]
MSTRPRGRPSAGAAGDLGYALPMLGAPLRPGAELVADPIGLDDARVDAV